MYEISVSGHFDAAHFLRGYQGKCANIHGHRWKIELALKGKELIELGIMIDFMDVKNTLKEVTGILDHKLINDVPPFDTINPSAENMAKYIHEEMTVRLQQMPGPIKVTRVTVWESEGAAASFLEENLP